MRRIAFFLLASGLFWTGCIGNDSLGSSMSAQRNIENLARISIGMTEPQVFQIMRQPYRSETFEIEGHRYDVWFYITRLLIMEQKEATPVNLTPLVFRNGVLEGKGYSYYHKIVKEESIAEAESGQNPKEDYELEKALTPPPGSKPAQPTKPVPAPTQQTKPPAQKKPAAPAAKPKSAPPSGQQTNQPSQTNPSGNQQPIKQPFPLSSPGTQPGAPAQPGTQPATPTQPHATQPPAPTQPGSSPTKPAQSSQSNVTMSKPSTPSESEPKKEEKSKPSKKEAPQTPKKKNVPLNEEDEKVLQEERQENFDFW